MNLAFEYQGVQHFEKSNVMNDVSTIQSKDEDKLVQASKEGIFVYVTLTHNRDYNYINPLLVGSHN